MTNPYPITPRQLDMDKLSGSSLKVVGSYPNVQLEVNFDGSPIAVSASSLNNANNSIYPAPMNHTHAIEASSNPTGSYILRSNSESGLTLQKLGIGISGSPSYDFEVNKTLTFTGAQSIETTSDDLTIAPANNLDFSPGGNKLVRMTNGVRIQSDTYASQTTGWGIGYNGGGDFRYLYADELHAKAFIADLEQALAGGQIISKSVAPLYSDFTVPSASGSTLLNVESFKGFDSFKVFSDNDIVLLREFSRSGSSLSIANCWGSVVWISTDTTDKYQVYQFTRSAGDYAGTATAGNTIAQGALVLDYGQEGNGIIESTAVDGVMGENSPYTRVANWTIHPANRASSYGIGTMAIGSTFVVGGSQVGFIERTRTGNLKGIFNVSNEFGFFAGDGVRSRDSYIRISNEVVEAHNLPVNLYDESALTISLDPYSPSFAMGSTLPSSYSVGDGLWMGKDVDDLYKFRIGNPNYNMLDWDGDALFIKANSSNYLKATGLGLGLYSNSVNRMSLDATGIFTINDSGGSPVITLDASTGAEITKKLTLSGANSALAIGSTYVPSGSTTGSGIWIDRNGWYGVSSGSAQAYMNSSDGKLYAGNEAVVLDYNGIHINAIDSIEAQRSYSFEHQNDIISYIGSNRSTTLQYLWIENGTDTATSGSSSNNIMYFNNIGYHHSLISLNSSKSGGTYDSSLNLDSTGTDSYAQFIAKRYWITSNGVSALQVDSGSSVFSGSIIGNASLNIKDGMTAPGTTAGFAKIYVDSADGDLKIKFGDGTVKTIVTDT